MARRKIGMNEQLEMIYQWHQRRSERQIRRSLGISRKTIRGYIGRLIQLGISREQPLPAEEELARLTALIQKPVNRFDQPAQEKLKPHHERIEAWLKEPHMTIQQVVRLLQEEHELEVGYMSVYRYVRRWIEPCKKRVTVRIHTAAGRQAQVDFGYAGLLQDAQTGKRRKAWAFIMILSYSRHRFVRFVFAQDSVTWIDCHLRAFHFFQGCPKTILLDNLKDGVLKPDIYDPTLNPAYAEVERYFGFVADPAKVRMARHKGKVERQVPVVRQQLMAGRSYGDIEQANQYALYWCREQIGARKHGTTHRKPYQVFVEEEAAKLLPLPCEPFESAQWKRCRIHADCHLVFDKSYYSAPYRYCDSGVWVRADQKLVRIYQDHRLLKTHLRAHRPGTWRTDEKDYPPGKLAFLEKTPAWCRRRAYELGSHVGEYIGRLLSDHALRNLRKAQGVLRLAEKHGKEALDQACRRALSFDNFRYQSLQQILEKGLWRDCRQPSEQKPVAATSLRFSRPAHYFVQDQEAP